MGAAGQSAAGTGAQTPRRRVLPTLVLPQARQRRASPSHSPPAPRGTPALPSHSQLRRKKTLLPAGTFQLLGPRSSRQQPRREREQSLAARSVPLLLPTTAAGTALAPRCGSDALTRFPLELAVLPTQKDTEHPLLTQSKNTDTQH